MDVGICLISKRKKPKHCFLHISHRFCIISRWSQHFISTEMYSFCVLSNDTCFGVLNRAAIPDRIHSAIFPLGTQRTKPTQRKPRLWVSNSRRSSICWEKNPPARCWGVSCRPLVWASLWASWEIISCMQTFPNEWLLHLNYAAAVVAVGAWNPSQEQMLKENQQNSVLMPCYNFTNCQWRQQNQQDLETWKKKPQLSS